MLRRPTRPEIIGVARRPRPAAALVALAVVACASSGTSARARGTPPRGVVAVAVVDTGTDAPSHPAASRPAPRAASAGGYRVTLEPPAEGIPVGAVRWLEAVVTDGVGRRVADAAVLWSSSDSGVVTVPRVGRALAPATGRAEGRAEVTARVGDAAATAQVTVGRPAAAVSERVPLGTVTGDARVRVEPARVDARVGDQVTLRAVALGARGETLRDCPLRWTTAGAPASPVGGAPPAGTTAVYRVLAAGPVMVTAACRGARGTSVVVVR